MPFLYYGSWGFFIVSMLIGLFATFYVNSTFSRYDRLTNSRMLTGAQVARMILDSHGLYHVQIVRVSGKLTDYYSDKNKTIALSDSVYGKCSVSAAGVAAHECGHAIQYSEDYAPIKIRNAIIPVANFGSQFWYMSVVIGLIMGNSAAGDFFIYLGIILFTLVCIFQLATLPVEFDASYRALKILSGENILTLDEKSKAAKVLRAAALTYVASLITSIMQLLRLLSLRNRDRRD